MRRFAKDISEVLICTMTRLWGVLRWDPQVQSNNHWPLSRSLYHHVAGCAVKTLLRQGLKLKHSNPKWARVVSCLLTCFKDSGADSNSQPGAELWTALLDRGGLTYVGEKALAFFYLYGSIASEVQPPSRYKFFERIYQSRQLVHLWEGIVTDKLLADESTWLMETTCRLFYNTYCNGYCNRAKNTEMSRGQASVSTRQRLARRWWWDCLSLPTNVLSLKMIIWSAQFTLKFLCKPKILKKSFLIFWSK